MTRGKPLAVGPTARLRGTTSLRGVSQQQIHGSKRSLRSVEDFTEFDQRTAYFDGDPIRATKKGMNILDRLEAALKERGFMIFTRLDHAAAAESVGLKMPKSTVLVFGNPRLGTPVFIKYPTLAIDLPLKALVWEDASGKVSVSYNSAHYLLLTIYGRHGAPTNPEAIARIEALLSAATDAAVK